MKNVDHQAYSVKKEAFVRDWPLWIIMLMLLVSAFLVYPHLPEQVPRHWNIYGEVDAYASRAFGAFFPPLMAIGLYLLMLFMPIIDPKKNNYTRFSKAYSFMRWGIVIFMGILYAATILISLGYPINLPLVVKVLVAMLFIIIGNFMGQFRHNYFVGIKTPWTLANEEVWQKTHRISGRIWVLAGLVCLAMAFLNSAWSAAVFFAAIAIMVIVPIVYSYVLFKKISELV